MKRLLRSSLFWNAVFGSVFAITSYVLTDGSELVSTGVFSLFGLRSFATGASDFMKVNKGITYDEKTGVDIMISKVNPDNLER